MRCKKHLSDPSSSVGVCATCLREKLLSVIAAQSQQSHSQSHVHHRNSHDRQQQNHPAINDSYRKSDRNPQPPASPPPLIFPRSVSPYISRRKSDSGGGGLPSNHYRHQVSVSHHPRFFSTPQAGPTISATSSTTGTSSSSKKKQGKFQAISKLFRSRSQKLGQPDLDSSSSSDPRIFTRQPCEESSSSSWITNFGFGRRKKTMRLLSLNETATSTIIGGRRDRGMSPDLTADEDDGGDGWPPCSPGLAQEEWKRTPRSAHASSTTKRSSHWGFRPSPGRSNLAFCLSPLVRASPTRHWYGKGAGAAGLGTPDIGYSGEIRGGGTGSVKPHISAASTYCANRSRKLADFGRSNPKR